MAELIRVELPEDRSHLTPEENAEQDRLLRLLTRQTPYSLGPELSPEEAAALPAINPQSYPQRRALLPGSGGQTSGLPRPIW